MSSNREIVARLENVSVEFPAHGSTVRALDSVSLELYGGTSTAITGRSGSGKSTLVSVLTHLRKPSSGKTFLAGEGRPKAERVGIVFQSFHLEQNLTAVDNVMLPWYATRVNLTFATALARSHELLDLVGIAHLANRTTARMSGGERQRVAIARSLLAQPRLLVADEPTGNLDEENSLVIRDLIFGLPTKLGTAVVVVTHDHAVAEGAQQNFVLQQGKLRDSLTEVAS